MTGRSYIAERIAGFALQDQIGGQHTRAGCPQRRSVRIRVHRRIGIKVHNASHW
jgi:hypothetical protein